MINRKGDSKTAQPDRCGGDEGFLREGYGDALADEQAGRLWRGEILVEG